MSFNGSGTFVINTAGQPVVANTVISATVFNALTADLATGLSTCITKDGQTTITANIPFGSNKITGLGAATAATDAATFGQVQSTAAKLITVTGTDTITGTMSPALTAYAAGQLFYFIANAANTGAMTINIDGLGAKAITRDGSTALIAGDVNTGEIVVICYDGTRFQMINAANSFGNTTINGTLTVTGNTGLQANVSITSTLSVGGTFAVTGAATLGSTLSVTGKSDLPVVSTASMNAAVAVITTGTVTNLTSTSASIASMNAGVALLTNATVTTLTATGASIASANIGNLQFTAASIASINAGVAVITNLTATGASIASMNAGVALLTTATVTALTATGASIASANVGTAVVTGLTVTNASIASANAGTATLSGNLTLNGGTANGVLYLNGSKVATSGSALTFDGTNFATTGNLDFGTVGAKINFPTTSSVTKNYVGGAADGFSLEMVTQRGAIQPISYKQDYSVGHVWSLTGSSAMTLDSTGLGIGTSSPQSLLNTASTGQVQIGTASWPSTFIGKSGARTLVGNEGVLVVWNEATAAANNAATLYIGPKGSGTNGATVIAGGAISGASEDGSTNKGYLRFDTNGGSGNAEKMRLDAAGNLGLGVSPSAWYIFKPFQSGIGALANTGSGDHTIMVSNGYYATGDVYKYIASTTATLYRQLSGSHAWFNAPSGTAGDTISFTQAATLDASGNFQIGGTTGGNRLRVTSADNTGTTAIARFESNNTNQAVLITFGGIYGSSGANLELGANATTKAVEIDTNKNVRVGTAALATTATDGFLYVPTCAGTPTGTPSSFTGVAPIVIDTTNNKLYFYSGGQWRDAGP